MSAPSTRHPPTFGPEPWAEVARQPWCHWDRWYCVVAMLDHDGDLGGVEDTLVAALSDALWGRAAAEAKLSHLAELRRRLDNAHLQSTDLVGPDDLADKVLVAKARRKVADRGLEGRAMTPAMVDTPRERLVRRARRGRWADFPVDPQRYYASFHRHVELKGHVSKNRSFDVVERLEERLERLDGHTVALSERLGLYRAFHSAGLELADRADDSFGVVGELRQRAWHTYLGSEWREAGIVPETYWADLCELVVWEDYGLGYRDELRPFLDVAHGEVDLVERLLVGLEAELEGVHLDYQAEAAATQIGWLRIAGRRFSRYEAAAARIGSRNWQPVVAMAESAFDAGRPEVAVTVFQAADQPGFHQGHLRQRCLHLTGVDLAAMDRGLRIVR